MKHTSSTTVGLLVAVLAAVAFGTSGAFIKPVLASGWSPAAAVTVRALIGGLVLAPFALIALRGRWDAVWRGRWRLLGMGLIGVAATQLVYFAALQTIAVGTAILVEYMAPLLLVAVAWVLTRRRPATVVLVGSVVSLVGLVLVVAPSGGSTLDPVGLVFAILAMVGCAAYYVISARPAKGLPPVAFAAIGLLIGALSLWLAGLVGVPFTTSDADVTVLGTDVVWWVPLLFVGVVSTAVAYAASITASQMLGSRLASFAGLLEVVAATGFAWILLGEQLSLAQLLGGVCILLGIGFVRSERAPAVPIPVAVQ
ncbi:EamA family transporter [Plantibacter auratus]|uniref:EamA family transporter n=1 Tax=Plantibacter auratus TaxID=272914 RepID=UPI003D32C7F8